MDTSAPKIDPKKHVASEAIAFNTLPKEIPIKILQYLSLQEITPLAHTNHFWRNLALEVTRVKMMTLFQEFADFLIKHLDKTKYEEKQALLLKVSHLEVKFDTINLLDLKLNLKSYFVNILKEIKQEDLNFILNVKEAVLFPSLIGIIKDTLSYQSLHTTCQHLAFPFKMYAFQHETEDSLFDLCCLLNRLGKAEEAIKKMASLEEAKKKSLLKKIISLSIDRGLVDTAIELVNKHFSDKTHSLLDGISDKEQASWSLAKELAETGHIVKALEVIDSIKNSSIRHEGHSTLSKLGQTLSAIPMNEALILIKTMSYRSQDMIKYYIKGLTSQQKLDQALSVVNTLHNEHKLIFTKERESEVVAHAKDWLLMQIFDVLKKSKDRETP